MSSRFSRGQFNVVKEGGRGLKRFREESNIPLKDIVNATGLTETTIKTKEAGRGAISMQLILKYDQARQRSVWDEWSAVSDLYIQLETVCEQRDEVLRYAGHTLRAIREQHESSRPQVAERFNVSAWMLKRVELGKATASEQILATYNTLLRELIARPSLPQETSHDDVMRPFPPELIELRETSGTTLAEVGALLDITESGVSHMEKREHHELPEPKAWWAYYEAARRKCKVPGDDWNWGLLQRIQKLEQERALLLKVLALSRETLGITKNAVAHSLNSNYTRPVERIEAGEEKFTDVVAACYELVIRQAAVRQNEDHEANKATGDLLRRTRWRARITLEQMAEFLGIKLFLVSSIERGELLPSAEFIRAYQKLSEPSKECCLPTDIFDPKPQKCIRPYRRKNKGKYQGKECYGDGGADFSSEDVARSRA